MVAKRRWKARTTKLTSNPAFRLDQRYLPLVLDTLDQGVFTVDRNTVITSFNRAAEEITGYTAAEAIGCQCSSIFQTDLCATECPLRVSLRAHRTVRDRRVTMQHRSGLRVPVSVSTAPLQDTGEGVIGGVEVFRDLSQLVDLERRSEGRFQREDIVGKSAAMQRVFDMLPLIARSDATVLITGPSGTGKEIVARAIHSTSDRSDGPFVAVNCAAIPETLLEAELFGHTKGAFTGARRDRAGRVASAQGGTIFLDEIGDLPMPMQVKVLRFLQEHSYERLGESRTRDADVRVIAATNRSVESLVEAGRFREDLYYRLNVLHIELPPLRERPEDVPLLVHHLLRARLSTSGKVVLGITDEALSRLTCYDFPGNVRELENIIERATILCQGDYIDVPHLPDHLAADLGDGRSAWSDEVTRIRAALRHHHGNRTHAAAELGMHRTTLVRKLRKFRIE